MAFEHIVWLTPKPETPDTQMEQIAAAIRNLTHIPGVLSISAGRNLTDRAGGATYGAIITLESFDFLEPYLQHPDHVALGGILREYCEVQALDYDC
jgi:hypothetical protein